MEFDGKVSRQTRARARERGENGQPDRRSSQIYRMHAICELETLLESNDFTAIRCLPVPGTGDKSGVRKWVILASRTRAQVEFSSRQSVYTVSRRCAESFVDYLKVITMEK